MIRFLLLAAVLPLASCVTTPPETDRAPAWHLNGRLVVEAEGSRRSLGIDWQQFEQDFVIDLFGPLGLGVARIQQQAGQVTLDRPGETTITASTAEELLLLVTGLDMPLQPLRYWVRGRPAPGDVEPASIGFVQAGWLVSYGAFADDLPRRITVSRPEGKLTLMIQAWNP